MKVVESLRWLLMTLLGWMPGDYQKIGQAGVTCAPPPGAPPPFSDALSAPTGDTLLPSIIAATPRGAAWRTDEVQDAGHNSFQHRFWRAIADPIADLYAKLWKLAFASTACTLSGPEDAANDALDDWENEFGLPLPCTILAPPNVAIRKLLLRQQIASAEIVAHGGQSIAFFVCLAASLGYTISISEIRLLRCGQGKCGQAEIGGPGNEVFWTVFVTTNVLTWFRCGQGICGRDPLGSLGRHIDLECLMNLWKPAHTQIRFHYIYAGPAPVPPPPPPPPGSTLLLWGMVGPVATETH